MTFGAPIRDDHIDWRWGHHYVSVQDMQSFITAAGAGAGAPVYEEVSTFGFVGLNMAATADQVCHAEFIPPEMARHHNIYVHVWYVNSPGVAADTLKWTFLYDTLAKGDAMIAPATALDTVLVTETVASATALTLTKATAGIIAARSIPVTDQFWTWSLTLTAADQTLASEKLDLLGVEFEYVRQWTHGKRERRGSRLTYPAGFQLGGRT